MNNLTSPARTTTLSFRGVRPQITPRSEGGPSKKPIDEHTFSWLDLGKGLGGAVIGGLTEGVGVGASSLLRGPQVGFEALKGMWQSDMLGNTLKLTMTPVIIAAGLASPLVATIGALGYGMFEGFKVGAEQSPLAAFGAGMETTKKFHNELAGGVIKGIREAAEHEPANPGEVYDIRLLEAGKGLAGSLVGAAVVGVGATGSTAYHLLPAYGKLTRELWKADMALPLKVGGQLLGTGAAVLAVPLSAGAGLIYGLGSGALHGYKEGVVDSAVHAAQDVKKYHQAVAGLLKD